MSDLNCSSLLVFLQNYVKLTMCHLLCVCVCVCVWCSRCRGESSGNIIPIVLGIIGQVVVKDNHYLKFPTHSNQLWGKPDPYSENNEFTFVSIFSFWRLQSITFSFSSDAQHSHTSFTCSSAVPIFFHACTDLSALNKHNCKNAVNTKLQKYPRWTHSLLHGWMERKKSLLI